MNDPDVLLRAVDGLCSSRDWATLIQLQLLCRDALTRGKQLWSVDHHIDYRLALEAPAEWAGPVVNETASRFLLGPLPEVAASTHGWNELAAYVPVGPARSVFAHERVLRGEDLSSETSIDPHVLEIPLAIESWEPVYALATYATHRADFPMPRLPALELADLPPAARKTEDRAAVDALTDVVSTWTESSNGRIDIACVEGSAPGAIAALGLSKVAIAQLDLSEAVSLIAWAGASGGAYGKRRGAASGRFSAWWTVASLTDLVEDWPVSGAELAAAGRELNWYAFSDLFPTTGWSFHLAVEDPEHDLAWAVAAGDAA